MIVARSRRGLATALGALRSSATGPTAAVLTMGSLHEGHLDLVREARTAVGADGIVALSLFVNPTQFGDGEDFDSYPRDPGTDIAVARSAGVDLAFVPTADVVYPSGEPAVTIDPGKLGTELEGAARPGHFSGVLTVVAKLLRLLEADVTPFGEKDYQQLVLVRRMLSDLEQPTTVLPVPIARDPDGLALSSRNVHLSAEDRRAALQLSTALRAGEAAAADGPAAAIGAARAVLDAQEAVDVDYLALRDSDLGPAPERGEARLLVAARVGGTRLLDNTALHLGSE